jgi:hypothetical protein
LGVILAKQTLDTMGDKAPHQSLEGQLLQKFGGVGNAKSASLPESLMFDHVSPATRLLEKRRQMFEVQEALNSQKEEFTRRENAFHRREDGLRRKDLELQESLIKFNQFLQENESKRNRAKKREADERKQREIKENEIKVLEAQLNSKLKEEALLNEELEKNIKYQDYLENVVQTMSKYFPEINDVLNRYNTLKDANAYLIDKQLVDNDAHDVTQKEFGTFKKAKENQILNNNNEIANMQVTYEHKKTNAMGLQLEIDQVTNEAGEKLLELGQILSSVTNILDRCEESFRIRHNKPAIDKSKVTQTVGTPLQEQVLRTISKLDEICMFVLDIKDIKDEYFLHEKRQSNIINNGLQSSSQTLSDGLNTESKA